MSAFLSSFFIWHAHFGATGNYKAIVYYFQSFEHPISVLPPDEWKGDSLQLAVLVQNALAQLHNMGYLSAQYRSYQVNDSLLNFQFSAGNRYVLTYLGEGNLPETMLNKVHYRQKFFREKAFAYPSIAKLFREIIKYSEKNGYPFASVRLDSIGIVASQLKCQIQYESGPLIVFDTVSVSGVKDLKHQFMMAQLGIYKNKPYDQGIVDQIPARIAAMSFLKLEEDPLVVYQNGKATIEIKATKRKINEVDGIVGLLPNETGNDKMLVTGQARINLHNLFASGKHLFIEWLRVQPQTQSLLVAYEHPKFLRSPLDLGGIAVSAQAGHFFH